MGVWAWGLVGDSGFRVRGPGVSACREGMGEI